MTRSPDRRASVRTAVIPAAGRGTRMFPATKALPKAMMPLVDKPAIQYVVEEALAAGLDDIVIVAPPGTIIEEHFRWDGEAERGLAAGPPALASLKRVAALARIRYVTQQQPLGLGHAVALARPLVGDAAFAILLPDAIRVDGPRLLREMIELFERDRVPVVALQRLPREELSAHGCAAVRPVRGRVMRVTDLVEKPPAGAEPSDLIIAGRYVFGSDTFAVLEALTPGHGGEIQLSDGLATLATTARVHGIIAERPHLDIGSIPGYLRASVSLALARDDMRQSVQGMAAVAPRDRGR